MLHFMKDRTTDRKARMLVCAAARLNWDNLPDERSRRAVEVGELLADGMADDSARWAAQYAARDAALEVMQAGAPIEHSICSFGACHCADATVDSMWSLLRLRRGPLEHVRNLPWRLVDWSLGIGKVSMREPSAEVWCRFIRDVFGSPFRPIAFDPRWRTADTVGLACGIYEDRAFDRLPLLSDALQDTGCADERVLGHCRSEGPHVRGCHVVDLVLGKN
jgi:hypothetical protein